MVAKMAEIFLCFMYIILVLRFLLLGYDSGLEKGGGGGIAPSSIDKWIRKKKREKIILYSLKSRKTILTLNQKMAVIKRSFRYLSLFYVISQFPQFLLVISNHFSPACPS